MPSLEQDINNDNFQPQNTSMGGQRMPADPAMRVLSNSQENAPLDQEKVEMLAHKKGTDIEVQSKDIQSTQAHNSPSRSQNPPPNLPSQGGDKNESQKTNDEEDNRKEPEKDGQGEDK